MDTITYELLHSHENRILMSAFFVGGPQHVFTLKDRTLVYRCTYTADIFNILSARVRTARFFDILLMVY